MSKNEQAADTTTETAAPSMTRRIIKGGLIVAGSALLGYAGYRVYKALTGSAPSAQEAAAASEAVAGFFSK